MKPIEFIKIIDDKILYKISEGSSLEEVVYFFKDVSNRSKKKDSFIDVNLSYLIKNWDNLDNSTRMNTLYVVFLDKRISDLRWLIHNRDRFPNFQGEKLYNILRLKDLLNV